MIQAIALAVSLPVIAWSLWIRRRTWHNDWEVGATLCILFQGLAIFLLSPLGDIFDPFLHRLTGVWNLEDFVGCTLFVGAAGSMVHHALIRLAGTETAQLLMDRWAGHPQTLILPLMFAAFVCSNGSKVHTNHFMALRPDAWLTAFWLLLGALVIWLLACGGRLWWLLRAAAKHRQQVTVYLIGSVVGIFATAARMLGACYPALVPEGDGAFVWIGIAVGAMLFAVALARSWQARAKWFRAPEQPKVPS